MHYFGWPHHLRTPLGTLRLRLRSRLCFETPPLQYSDHGNQTAGAFTSFLNFVKTHVLQVAYLTVGNSRIGELKVRRGRRFLGDMAGTGVGVHWV